MTEITDPAFAGELLDVRFQQVNGVLVAPDVAQPWQVDYDLEPFWDVAKGSLVFLLQLTVRAWSGDLGSDDADIAPVTDDDLVFKMTFGVLLSYRLPEGETRTPAKLAAAGVDTALRDGWPYLRRAAQDMSTQLAVPPLTDSIDPVLPAAYPVR